MFVAVLWKGICQVLKWFFGLFGYKRDGKFAKCVWGLFAVSAAIVMCFIAIGVTYAAYEEFYGKYRISRMVEAGLSRNISNTIAFVEPFNGRDGYLLNTNTGKKVLKDVDWIALPAGDDSLVCFSRGTRRGYFSKNTGRVVVEPQFRHAWIFSNGRASVAIDGKIKFIDGTGKVVIDNGLVHDERQSGYVFKGNYCIVYSEDGTKCGLMDRNGKFVLPVEYSDIQSNDQHTHWAACKDGKSAVYDQNMKQILPPIDGEVFLFTEVIDVTMADHTMRKYDYDGNLINDFYVSDVSLLEYETGEIYYTPDNYIDEEGEEYRAVTEKHKKATARLRSYMAGDEYQGLMTADGHIVTMPLYKEIEAIGPDTYLCTVDTGDNVVLDGKGMIVSRP